MYKVLLVDDEPIILSGIKFLIDWEQNDCLVVGSARNGQEALEKILLNAPDILICDINMPVMSGIDLLRQINTERPEIVFIMLTNLQEFDLARESLRLRAVDYLLKNKLETDTLIKSLNAAKTERDQRNRLALADSGALSGNPRQLIRDLLLHLVRNAPGRPAGDLALPLEENGFLPDFALLYLPVAFSPEETSFQHKEDRARLFAWQQEVVSKLAHNFFPNHCLFAPDQQCDSLIMACWGVDQKQWDDKLKHFHTRLASVSGNITQLAIGLLATDLFTSLEQLEQCHRQLFALLDYYYLTDCSYITPDAMPSVEYRSLGLSGIGGKLESELNVKNLIGCAAVFDKAICNVESIEHRRSQATWLCSELYGTVSDVIFRVLPEIGKNYSFFDKDNGYQEIELLYTRRQVLLWLKRFRNEVIGLLSEQQSGRNEIAERSRQYVLDHVYDRIMLQDVANYVCISPGYLSATFKKMYNQNLVDFINQVKMQTACKLIEDGKHNIGEISCMLSFENAYYFTKVFKRHTGMTPTEYQRRQKG